MREIILTKIANGHAYVSCLMGDGLVYLALDYGAGECSSAFVEAPDNFHAAARPLR